MPNRVPLRDDYAESRLIRQRLVFGALFVLVLTVILILRLYMLQISNYQHFTTLSKSNRVRIKALPPTRGLIFDRHGVVMANNLSSYQVEIVQEQVEDIDQTLQRLKHYVDYSEQDLLRFTQASLIRRPFESIPLKLSLSDAEVARLAANLHELNGVEINARLTRHYPQNKQAAHILGYVSRIDKKDLRRIERRNYASTSHIGKLGLERFYEKTLHGQIGVQQIEVNARGRTLRVLSEVSPIAGSNLYLTIDSALQSAAEAAFDGQTGALVAIDPNNGEILALVSVPVFDPNPFVSGISYDAYDQLRDSPDRPLFNRALSGQYPPGSTTKPFVGLAGLETGSIGKNTTIFCPGYYRLPNDDRKYRDWKKHGHGVVDMRDAITQSCDIYFYDLAYKLGIDKMSRFLAEFGFGVKTGIDSIGEKPGLLPSREWKRQTQGTIWFPGETLITGIGQGALLVTPLQLANSTAALANKGTRYRPRLVKAIGSSQTSLKEEFKAEPVYQYQLKHPQNWQHIHQSMIRVVHHWQGTAQSIQAGLSYKIAGKTGTAQVMGIASEAEYDEENTPKKLRDHALFISYAPADKPQIAIAVIVENGGHGGSVAAPIGRKVIDAYLKEKS